MMIDRVRVLLLIATLSAQLGCVRKQAEDITFGKLTINGLDKPAGIIDSNPYFGWQLLSEVQGQKQTAYEVIVSTSKAGLEHDTGDLWESGRVPSDQSQLVEYAGIPLKSTFRFFWKVRIWDMHGNRSTWSQPQQCLTGILHEADLHASWITYREHKISDERGRFGTYAQTQDKHPGDTSSVIFRKTFSLEKQTSNAHVYVTGLGYYELYINGDRVGEHVLDPVFSDYQKSVYYSTYDVTGYLQSGINEIVVLLGNGFYNSPTQDLFMMDQAHWKAPPKLLLQMHIQSSSGRMQTVVSDSSWTWSEGPVVWNCIRGGETVDAKRYRAWLQFLNGDEANLQWQPTHVTSGPGGVLRPQHMPPMRITETIDPLSVWSPSENVFVVDFGENITGSIKLKGLSCTQEIASIFFNEKLTPDSTLDKRYSSGHTRGRFQETRIICHEDEIEFQPRFAYHGFRYVQIEGIRNLQPSQVQALSIHTDLASRGQFACSFDSLNMLQRAVVRTLLNSVHSMPGEEPTREKMGWTFDAGMATMESYLYHFEAESTYRKYLQDLIDGQEPNGHIPPIVPTNGWGYLEENGDPIRYDDPWWGSTLFFVADQLIRWTGDSSILTKAYPAMARYLAFVSRTADRLHHVHWSLGDWLDMTHGQHGWGPGLTPVLQTSTACYYWMASEMARHATAMGLMTEADEYLILANAISASYNNSFLDHETGWYEKGSQTAQALPLYLGLVPDSLKSRVEARLLEAIDSNKGHISTGFVGVQPLLHFLSGNEHFDVVYDMVTKQDSPGWLHMIQNGYQSTLGENLNAKGYGTGHHPFGACIGHWFYQYLMGIRPSSRGWKEIEMNPMFPIDLDSASASINTQYGIVESKWRRSNGGIIFNFTIPVNTTAQIKLPNHDWRPFESGKYELKVDTFDHR